MSLADGTYLTERILPGRYVVGGEAFTPLTPEQQFRSGVAGPAFRAAVKVDVPTEGEVDVPELALK